MKVFGKIVFWRLGVTLAGKGREKEQATVGREGNDAGARHSLEFGVGVPIRCRPCCFYFLNISDLAPNLFRSSYNCLELCLHHKIKYSMFK